MKYGLDLILSEECNANCVYCYQKHHNRKNHITKENVHKIMKWVEADVSFDRSVYFLGGEPSMRIDILKEVINNYPDNEYSIISNGYFTHSYSKEDYEWLINHIDHFMLSIEATPDLARKYRKIDDLYKFIDKCCDNLPNANFSIVFGDYLYDHVDEFLNTVRYIKNKSNTLDKYIMIRFHVERVSNTKDGNEKLYSILKYIKEVDIEIYKEIIGYKYDIINYLTYNNKIMCDLEDTVHIQPDGSILPCGHFVDNFYKDKKYWYDFNSMEDIMTYTKDNFSYIDNYDRSDLGCDKCFIRNKNHCLMCSAIMESCNDIEVLRRGCERSKMINMLRMELLEEVETVL